MTRKYGRRQVATIAAVTAAVAGSAAGPAHAAIARAAATCAASSTIQAFSQFGDGNQYELVPGGSFSGASPGWTLTGGARIVSVQLPFDLGVGSASALFLPAGASAQSPPLCVDGSDPTYRFVGASAGVASLLSSQAVYSTPLGLKVPVTAVSVPLQASWAPTAPLLTGSAPVSMLSGGTAQLSIRFTAAAPTLVDDVFVDPRMHN